MTKRVIIIGGGPIGVTTFYELTKRGCAVVLIESRGELGSGASFANGGVLTPSLSDPWNGPGVGGHLFASLFEKNAAMKLQPHAIPGLLLWGSRFLRNSLPKRHKQATLASYLLAEYSVEQTKALVNEIELDWQLYNQGTLKTFESEDAFQDQLALAEMLGEEGLSYQVLSSAEVVQYEPQLEAASERIVKAIYYPNDVSGDARSFSNALGHHTTGLGGEVRLNETVRSIKSDGRRILGVETDKGFIEAEDVIIAAGNASPLLTQKLGVHLPIAPAKGYSITIDTSGWNARPNMPVIDGATHFGVAPLGDRLRCVGVAEFTGRDATVKPERIAFLFELFDRLFPDLSPNLDREQAQTWAGLRPMSADGLPFIGRTKLDGLWINSGHGHLGWTMAMGSAAMLADMMTGQTPQIGPDAYQVHR